MAARQRTAAGGQSEAIAANEEQSDLDGIVISRVRAARAPQQPAALQAGPLAGVRLAVKDNIDVAGVITTMGSRFVAADARPAAEDAAAVHALTRAGAQVVAKVNLHEFAYGVSSANPWFGAVPNPAFPDRIAGGSSGGSAAALAAGIADLALGTDTAGSIRMPAGCVGVVGLRPRHGQVSLAGVGPLCPSFDTVGPMGLSVADVARAWGVLREHAGVANTPAEGLRVRGNMGELRVAVLDAGSRLPAGLGAELTALGATRVASPWLSEEQIERVLDDFWPAFRYEAARTHASTFPAREGEYDPDVARKLRGARTATRDDHEASLRQLAAHRDQLLTAWDLAGVDVLITPTLGCDVPDRRADEREYEDAIGRYAAVFSALNLAALAIGGIQIVGRTEADVLGVGLMLEERGMNASHGHDAHSEGCADL